MSVRKRKKALPAILLAGLFFFCCLFGTAGASGASSAGRRITVLTRVTKWGQLPYAFVVEGQSLPEGLAPGDFKLTGEAGSWGSVGTHPFSCGIRQLSAEADGWRLEPEDFPEKYFYVRSLTLTCPAAPELDFTLEDVSAVETETADLFTLWESDNRMIKAQVYQPEQQDPLPVVVVFHGYGDTANLLTYRTAVDWAEPEHQQVRPCIVIAPVIEDTLYASDNARTKIYRQLMDWIDALIEEGRADPDRIYLMGNSFGGMASFEMAEQYPDRIAAVLALCPALGYSKTALASLPKITGIPVLMAHAEHDETIPVSTSRQALQMLEEAGGQAELIVFGDAEMEAAGASLGSENVYSFHHVELCLLENTDYADWLFARHRGGDTGD